MMSGCVYKSKRERAGTNHKGKDLLAAEEDDVVEEEDKDDGADAMFRKRSRRQL